MNKDLLNAICRLVKDPIRKTYDTTFKEADKQIMNKLGNDLQINDCLYVNWHWRPKILCGKEVWREVELYVEVRSDDYAISMGKIEDAGMTPMCFIFELENGVELKFK